ncbi:uncharacterized protein LOC134856706 [Symsagittifera roscoffensis]|uniref:uncharacterized protein LOC134856706 n=1 Tax=Symsagittifera roscoffensis TaxID=84072 RepID=UPI00307C63CF
MILLCSSIFFILKVGVTLCTVPGSLNSSSGAADGPRWMSQQFVLPNFLSFFGLRCRQMNQMFCLSGVYFGLDRVSDRLPRESDLRVIEMAVRPSYKLINWYPFLRQNPSDICCSFQKYIYQTQGQEKGVSPEEYLDLLFDFYAPEDKQVNWIQATYISKLCYNVITEIGFGPGQLKMSGEFYLNEQFVLPVEKGMGILKIPGNDIRGAITFRWFRKHIICESQPWICTIDDPSDWAEERRRPE